MKTFLCNRTRKCFLLCNPVITLSCSTAQNHDCLMFFLVFSLLVERGNLYHITHSTHCLEFCPLFSFCRPLTSNSNLIHTCIESFINFLVDFLPFMHFFCLYLQDPPTLCSMTLLSFLEPYSCSNMSWGLSHPHS